MTVTLVSPPVTATETALTACIPHMRAFARILTGDQTRADDLVETAIRRAWAGPEPALQAGGMKRWVFTLLHVLHYGGAHETRAKAPPDGTEVTGQRKPHVDNFTSKFWQLRDDQREILILEAAADLSRADVAVIYGAPPGMADLRASMACQSLVARLHATGQADRTPVAAAVIDYARVLVPVWSAANLA